MIGKIMTGLAVLVGGYLLLILLQVWDIIDLSEILWARLTTTVILVGIGLGIWAGVLALKREHSVTNADGDRLIR